MPEIPDHLTREQRQQVIADVLRHAAEHAEAIATWKRTSGAEADKAYAQSQYLRDRMVADGIWNAARAARAAAFEALENELIARQRGPGSIGLGADGQLHLYAPGAEHPVGRAVCRELIVDRFTPADAYLRGRCSDCFDGTRLDP